MNTFQECGNDKKKTKSLIRILPEGGPYEDDGKLGGP